MDKLDVLKKMTAKWDIAVKQTLDKYTGGKSGMEYGNRRMSWGHFHITAYICVTWTWILKNYDIFKTIPLVFQIYKSFSCSAQNGFHKQIRVVIFAKEICN